MILTWLPHPLTIVLPQFAIGGDVGAKGDLAGHPVTAVECTPHMPTDLPADIFGRRFTNWQTSDVSPADVGFGMIARTRYFGLRFGATFFVFHNLDAVQHPEPLSSTEVAHPRQYATSICEDKSVETFHRNDLLKYIHHCLQRDLPLL